MNSDIFVFVLFLTKLELASTLSISLTKEKKLSNRKTCRLKIKTKETLNSDVNFHECPQPKGLS